MLSYKPQGFLRPTSENPVRGGLTIDHVIGGFAGRRYCRGRLLAPESAASLHKDNLKKYESLHADPCGKHKTMPPLAILRVSYGYSCSPRISEKAGMALCKMS